MHDRWRHCRHDVTSSGERISWENGIMSQQCKRLNVILHVMRVIECNDDVTSSAGWRHRWVSSCRLDRRDGRRGCVRWWADGACRAAFLASLCGGWPVHSMTSTPCSSPEHTTATWRRDWIKHDGEEEEVGVMYLEFEGAALSRRDEVVWDAGGVVELGDFDGKSEAVGMWGAVPHNERPHILLTQHLQRDLARDSRLVPGNPLQLLVIENALRVSMT